MKARLIIFFSVFLLLSATGQEKIIKKAQHYVDKSNFEKALKTLDRADPELTEPFLNDYNLVKGLALDGLGDLDSALYYYESVIYEKNLNDIPTRVIIEYAQSLYQDGDYNGALFFVNRARESLFGTKYPEGLEQIAMKSQWAINNLDKFSARMGADSILDIRMGMHKLVVDAPTFGAAYYNDSLVFSSYTEYERPTPLQEEAMEHNEILQDYKRTNTDLYIASLNDSIGARRLFAEEIQSLNNEGAISFNEGQTQMYFTRHHVDRKGKDNYKIYYAERDGENWIDKGPLNFNSDDFSCLHPNLSADGKTLYFVSNNQGGYGGFDIYSSEGSGTSFSIPLNLGSTINSSGDEIFPYMDDDSTMIYSSNGLMGFGGYDIYWVNMKHKDAEPYNLLQPINSNSDDYCIVGKRHAPEQMLFFSDRDMSFGAFALDGEEEEEKTLSFSIELLTPERRALGWDYTQFLSKGESILKPVVENIKRKELEKQLAENSSIINGKVITTEDGYVLLIDSVSGELINVPGNLMVNHGKVITNDLGNFILVDSLSGSVIDVTKVTTEYLAETDEDIIKRDFEEQIVQNKDIVNGKIVTTEDGAVLLIDSVSGELIKVPNNVDAPFAKVVKTEDGGYALVDKYTGEQIEVSVVDGELVVESGYDGETDEPDMTEEELRSTSSGELGAKLQSIFFNKNSSDLSEQSKRNLEMVASYLKAKPKMKLIISGHASMRGNHSYNLCISAYRSKQAYLFLTQNLGVSPQSLILLANGKYFPLVHTYDVEKGFDNRRVDLIADLKDPQKGIEINFKIEKKYTDEFEAKLFRIFKKQNPDVDYLYIADRTSNLQQVAKAYELKTSDLQRMNDMGRRNYLFDKEVIMVIPFKIPVKHMVFKARVQDLIYIPEDTQLHVIASKYGVEGRDILRVNELEGEIIPKHTRLIIPLTENNK